MSSIVAESKSNMRNKENSRDPKRAPRKADLAIGSSSQVSKSKIESKFVLLKSKENFKSNKEENSKVVKNYFEKESGDKDVREELARGRMKKKDEVRVTPFTDVIGVGEGIKKLTIKRSKESTFVVNEANEFILRVDKDIVVKNDKLQTRNSNFERKENLGSRKI